MSSLLLLDFSHFHCIVILARGYRHFSLWILDLSLLLNRLPAILMNLSGPPDFALSAYALLQHGQRYLPVAPAKGLAAST